MNHASNLYRFVRFANSLLLACGLALAVDQSMAAAYDRFDQVPHWRTEDRSLVLVDKTADKAWHEATRHAVNAWNRSAQNTGLRLTWKTGTGVCTAGGTSIELCKEPNQTLGDDIDTDRQGLTDIRLGPDRTQAHIGGTTISVCSNCRLDPARRRVIAAHELGHALGLEHNLRLGSVMYPTGGPDRPDAADGSALRQLYAHVDAEDRCGFFDLRLGVFCF